MSFCRWSTDDFKCDLYIYASVYGGYSINIAGRKRIYHEPLPPEIEMNNDIEGFLKRHFLIMDMPHKMVDINLPYAGETFDMDNEDDVIEFLKELKRIGYIFPDYVIEMIQKEKED